MDVKSLSPGRNTVCEEFPSPPLLHNLVQLALVEQLLIMVGHHLLLHLNSGFIFIRHLLYSLHDSLNNIIDMAWNVTVNSLFFPSRSQYLCRSCARYTRHTGCNCTQQALLWRCTGTVHLYKTGSGSAYTVAGRRMRRRNL